MNRNTSTSGAASEQRKQRESRSEGVSKPASAGHGAENRTGQDRLVRPDCVVLGDGDRQTDRGREDDCRSSSMDCEDEGD